ncbi:MAG: AgmX/PglI C-terminal domain-containing protein [Alteromonas sp.]
MIAVTPYYFSTLPWSSGEDENRRFERLVLITLVLTVVLAALVFFVEVPEQTREEKAKIPPQLAKILEAEDPPVAELPEPEPEPDPVLDKPEPEPEPKPEPEPERLPEPEPVAEVTPHELEIPEITDEQRIEKARETASQSGVLNFADDLASLRDSVDVGNLVDTQLTEGAGEQEETQRNIIGQVVDQTSGGIDLGDLSTNVGARGTLEGRKTTEFNAPTEGTAALATQRLNSEPTVLGDRSVEDIRKSMSQNRGGLYSLYRRALRSEPELQGKLTVRLVIEPNGQLSSVTLVGTDLDSTGLVERLLARIRLISFGAQDVTTTEIEYTYNFFPF